MHSVDFTARPWVMQAEQKVTNPQRSIAMKIMKPHSLLLALCLGLSASVVLAATDLNDQRAPGTQPHDSGHMNNQGGATGSGTPADAMGTGSGGTDGNDTDNTGGDGTTDRSGSDRSGSERGTGTGSGTGGAGGSGSSGGSGS
ncbi:MAG: hypothetical protein ACWA7E_02580 [Pseudomonas asiatica]